MAYAYATGFEYGITPVTTGLGLADYNENPGSTTLAIDTSVVRSGTYSLKIGSTILGRALWSKQISSAGTQAARFYVYPQTLPSSGNTTFCLLESSSGANRVFLYVDSSGVVTASFDGGSSQAGASLTTGEWNRIDLLYDHSGTTWTLDWQINGVAQTQISKSGLSAATGARWIRLCAENSAATTSLFYFDDVVCAESAEYPIGPGKVLLAPLASAAAHQTITLTEWQYTDNFSTFTNFASQTETNSPSRLGPPISTATPTGFRMNTTAAVAGNGRWPIDAPADMPSGNAQMVSALICVREASTGTNNATFRTELSGSTTNIFSGNPGWGTTWNYLGSFMANKPGGTGWTKTDVDALNFEADSTDASPNIWCQGVVYEVAFAASDTSGTTLSPAQLTHTRAMYGPTVVYIPKPGQLTHTRAIYSPVVKSKIFTDFLTHTRAIYTLGVGAALSPTQLAHTRAIYSPVVNPAAGPGFFEHTRAIYAPTLNPRVVASFIDRTRALYSPTTSSGTTLVPDFLSHTRGINAPNVIPLLSPGGITHIRAFYSPTVHPTLYLSQLTHDRAAYPPVIFVGSAPPIDVTDEVPGHYSF